MARLDITLEHGQPPELAQARFEEAIDDALSRFGSWVGRFDWGEDRRSATVSGSGYEVRLWYDERFVHAQGQVPLAWKLFEGAIRGQMRQAIERAGAGRD